ncbi:hypothetical protein [Streptomyces sp. NPDC002587]
MAHERRGSPTAVACLTVAVPPPSRLSWEQIRGRACVACGEPLTGSRVHRGVVVEREGAMLLDFDVYSCPPSEGAA